MFEWGKDVKNWQLDDGTARKTWYQLRKKLFTEIKKNGNVWNSTSAARYSYCSIATFNLVKQCIDDGS